MQHNCGQMKAYLFLDFGQAVVCLQQIRNITKSPDLKNFLRRCLLHEAHKSKDLECRFVDSYVV